MADTDNDIKIGVEVSVSSNDAPAQLEAKLKGIEEKAAASNRRQETETARSNDALKRLMDAAAPTGSSASGMSPAMLRGVKTPDMGELMVAHQAAFTSFMEAQANVIRSQTAAFRQRQNAMLSADPMYGPKDPNVRQIGAMRTAEGIGADYGPSAPTAAERSAMRAAEQAAQAAQYGPPQPTSAQLLRNAQAAAPAMPEMFGPPDPSAVQALKMRQQDYLSAGQKWSQEYKQGGLYGPPEPTFVQRMQSDKAASMSDAEKWMEQYKAGGLYGPPSPTNAQLLKNAQQASIAASIQQAAAQYGPPSPTAAQQRAMNAAGGMTPAQQFNQQFSQGQVYGPPNPTNAQQVRMAAPPTPPPSVNPAGGGAFGDDFGFHAWNAGLGALTQTMSNLQYWTVRLAEVGFGGLITEITLSVGLITKLVEKFVSVNEQFTGFELTLGSVFKSATDAQDVRKTVAGITATSPVPFEGIAELVKTLAVNPMLRPQMVQQVRAGGIDDTDGFLKKNVRLLEQMLAFRPDKTAADAIFSLREALAGQFRSITRRFDIPESTISAMSGTSRADLASDPQKALLAIQKTFSQIIDPSAISQMAMQPSKLFQNLLEQIVVIPLLTLGKDTRIASTGKSLYDSMLAPFQKMLTQASTFISPPKGSSNAERPDFATYAQQMAEPLFSIFNKVFGFLADTLEGVLNHFGFSTTQNPGQSLLERISGLIVVSLKAIDDNVLPALTKAREVIFNFAAVFQKLVDTVLWALDKFGPLIAQNPGTSLLAAVAAVPAATAGVKIAGSAIGGVLDTGEKYNLAQAAARAAASGAPAAAPAVAGIGESIAGTIAMIMPYVIAAVVAAAVIGAIVMAVKSYNAAQAADYTEQNDVLKKLAYSTTPGSMSPAQATDMIKQYAKLQSYEQENTQYIEGGQKVSTLPDDVLAKTDAQLKKLKDSIVALGFSADSNVFSYDYKDFADPDTDAGRLMKTRAAYQPVYTGTEQVNARNLTKLANPGVPSGEFLRTPDSERQFPALAESERTQSNLLALTASPTNDKLDAAQKKLSDQLNPLKELFETAKALQADNDEIYRAIAGTPSTNAIQTDVKNQLELAKGFLANLKSHPVKDNDLVEAANGEQMMYKDAEEYSKQRIAYFSTLFNGRSQAEIDRIKGVATLAMSQLQTNAANKYTTGAESVEAVFKQFQNFDGTQEQANQKAEQLGTLLRMLDVLPGQKIDALVKTLETNVVFKGTGKSNQDLNVALRLENAVLKVKDDFVEGYTAMMDAAAAKVKEIFALNNFAAPSFGPSDAFSISTSTQRRTTTQSTQASPMSLGIGTDTPLPEPDSGYVNMPGINGGPANNTNPISVSLANPQGQSVIPSGATAAGAGSQGPIVSVPSASDPMIPGERPQDDIDVILAKQRANAEAAQPPPAVTSMGQQAQSAKGVTTNEITTQTNTDTNRAIDASLSSLNGILSKAGDTGRGDNEGRVALQQFNQDLATMTAKFPELVKGIGGEVDSLYTNVTKLGASGSDVTIQKLLTAAKIAGQLADNLDEMAKTSAATGTETGKIQAQRYTTAANQFRMSQASDQDKAKSMQLSDDPLASFGAGFAAQTKKPENYFTDLRTVGMSVASDLSSAFSNAFVGFVDGSKTAGQAFAAFGKSILDTIAKIASQKASEAILNLVASAAGSFFGGGVQPNSMGTTNPSYEPQTYHYASGGPVRGGSGHADDVDIKAMGGEFVMNKRATQLIGKDWLTAANYGIINPTPSGYAMGGPIGTPQSPGQYAMSMHYGGDNFQIQIPIDNRGNSEGSSSSGSDSESARKQKNLQDSLETAVIATIKKEKRVSGSLYRATY